MKLRAISTVTVSGHDYHKGDVFEALPEQAVDLIRLGMVEEVVPPAEPPAEPPQDPPEK